MGNLDLVVIATQLLQIHTNWRYSCRNGNEKDFELCTFTQIWGNTSGGFEGIGGSAMTEERTYVFISKMTDECLVYFGSRFAYSCKKSDNFLSDVLRKDVCGLSTCRSRYDVNYSV